MDQRQMFYKAHRHLADANHTFMDMVNSEGNPLTSAELRRLIARFPQRWARFANWVKTLEERERG